MLSASPAFAVVDFTATLYALFLLFLVRPGHRHVLDRIRAVTPPLGHACATPTASPGSPRRSAWLVFGFSGYLSARASAGFSCSASEIYLLAMLLAVFLTWRSGRDTRPFGRPCGCRSR